MTQRLRALEQVQVQVLGLEQQLELEQVAQQLQVQA